MSTQQPIYNISPERTRIQESPGGVGERSFGCRDGHSSTFGWGVFPVAVGGNSNGQPYRENPLQLTVSRASQAITSKAKRCLVYSHFTSSFFLIRSNVTQAPLRDTSSCKQNQRASGSLRHSTGGEAASWWVSVPPRPPDPHAPLLRARYSCVLL